MENGLHFHLRMIIVFIGWLVSKEYYSALWSSSRVP